MGGSIVILLVMAEFTFSLNFSTEACHETIYVRFIDLIHLNLYVARSSLEPMLSNHQEGLVYSLDDNFIGGPHDICSYFEFKNS